MKKIKDIQQLKAAQKKLARRKAELEKAIRYDWMDLKETLKPRNLAGQAFSGMFDERSAEKKPGADLVAEVLTKLAAKAFEKAGDKIGKWMRRK